MMGERMVMQEALFYEFSIELHVPVDHLLARSTASSTCLGCGHICGHFTARLVAPRSIRN